jgi:hypothetical protein
MYFFVQYSFAAISVRLFETVRLSFTKFFTEEGVPQRFYPIPYGRSFGTLKVKFEIDGDKFMRGLFLWRVVQIMFAILFQYERCDFMFYLFNFY